MLFARERPLVIAEIHNISAANQISSWLAQHNYGSHWIVPKEGFPAPAYLLGRNNTMVLLGCREWSVNRHFLHTVPQLALCPKDAAPQNRNLLFRRVVLALFPHPFDPLS